MQKINVDIRDKIFVGIVEDNKDPNRKGRIKVRVQSIFDNIPLEDIPYASPYRDLAGKSFRLPSIGKIVNVIFLNDDIYDPNYIYSENYNINLENKLKNMNEDDYVDFVSLLFDERTQIFSDEKDFVLDYKYNKFRIDDKSINVELKDNNQKLNLGSKDPNQEAVLGTNFFKWMDKFIRKLLVPTTLTGNLAAPIIRPELDALLLEYQAIRSTFVSKNVYINDNGKIKKLKRDPSTSVVKDDKDFTMDLSNIVSEPEPKNLIKTDYLGEKSKENIKKERDKSVEKELESLPTKFIVDDAPFVNENKDGTEYVAFYKILDGDTVETDEVEYLQYKDSKKLEIKKNSGLDQTINKSIPTMGDKKDIEYRETQDGRIAIFDSVTKKFIRYK